MSCPGIACQRTESKVNHLLNGMADDDDDEKDAE